jgi:hypothetical protein
LSRCGLAVELDQTQARTDGHAKNFSIFLLPGGGHRTTPPYEVISVWPVIGNGPNLVAWQEAKLAMAVRSKTVHYELARIHTRHWQGLAQRGGVEGIGRPGCWSWRSWAAERNGPRRSQRLADAGDWDDRTANALWPAAGFDDALLRCSTKPEVVHGDEMAVQPRVQARDGEGG